MQVWELFKLNVARQLRCPDYALELPSMLVLQVVCEHRTHAGSLTVYKLPPDMINDFPDDYHVLDLDWDIDKDYPDMPDLDPDLFEDPEFSARFASLLPDRPTISRSGSTIPMKDLDPLLNRLRALSLPCAPTFDVEVSSNASANELTIGPVFCGTTIRWLDPGPPSWAPALSILSQITTLINLHMTAD